MTLPNTSRLSGSRCQVCGRTYYPPRGHCAECKDGTATTPHSLNGEGVLYTYTTLHVGNPNPLTLGYIDLAEGVRVLADLSEIPNPRIGEPVRVVQVDGQDRDFRVVGHRTQHGQEGK